MLIPRLGGGGGGGKSTISIIVATSVLHSAEHDLLTAQQPYLKMSAALEKRPDMSSRAMYLASPSTAWPVPCKHMH